jgi:hypothetical protein
MGAESCSDPQLLVILLGSNGRGYSALDTASALLDTYGTLAGLMNRLMRSQAPPACPLDCRQVLRQALVICPGVIEMRRDAQVTTFGLPKPHQRHFDAEPVIKLLLLGVNPPGSAP